MDIQEIAHVLLQHPAVSTAVASFVGESGGFEVQIEMNVQLPSRLKHLGKTPDGIKSREPCWLVFASDWPLHAPKVFLREDFPLSIPHINPYHRGARVNPCLFDVSLDEVLHCFGLEKIVDQLSEWLDKAASGQLANTDAGWEPTRRDSTDSFAIFSAEKIIDHVSMSKTPLIANGFFLRGGKEIISWLPDSFESSSVLQFAREMHPDVSSRVHGKLSFMFFRCVDNNNEPKIVSEYAPESVHDVESFYEYASSLNIDTSKIKRYFSSLCNRAFCNRKLLSEELYVVVSFLVHRPAQLVSSSGRYVEVLPYLVRLSVNSKQHTKIKISPIAHLQDVSPELLHNMSGLDRSTKEYKIILAGCGSLGSKIGLHFARSGIGDMIFIDNEIMQPHNNARHAITSRASLHYKSELLQEQCKKLGYDNCKSLNTNIIDLFMDENKFENIVGKNDTLIIDSTASFLVNYSASKTRFFENHPERRLLQTGMYSHGRISYLFLEGYGRTVTVGDLRACFFNFCRTDQYVAKMMRESNVDLTRVFIGETCSSFTMKVSDSIVSRSASLVSSQLEKWITRSLPKEGVLCFGLEDESSVGMIWKTLRILQTKVFFEKSWSIRILDTVVSSISDISKEWENIETGGILLGHVCCDTKTITISAIVDAPEDSQRSEASFIMGTKGMRNSVVRAYIDSFGYLQFVGTWHSHPRGGRHSEIDLTTLKRLANGFSSWPAVSLVWTPEDFLIAIQEHSLAHEPPS